MCGLFARISPAVCGHDWHSRISATLVLLPHEARKRKAKKQEEKEKQGRVEKGKGFMRLCRQNGFLGRGRQFVHFCMLKYFRFMFYCLSIYLEFLFCKNDWNRIQLKSGIRRSGILVKCIA